MMAEGDSNSELIESSGATNHGSVCVDAVVAINHVIGCQGRCTVGLEKSITSAVGCCNSS